MSPCVRLESDKSCVGLANPAPEHYFPVSGMAFTRLVPEITPSESFLRVTLDSSLWRFSLKMQTHTHTKRTAFCKLIHKINRIRDSLYLLSFPTCMCQVPSRVRLCNPMDCSPPGSPVYGIIQARILQWVAKPSSRKSSPPRDLTCLSYISVSWIDRRVLYD